MIQRAAIPLPSSCAASLGRLLDHWLLGLALVLCLMSSGCAAQGFSATPVPLHSQLGPGDRYAGIRLLGTLKLADASINGLRLCGLSGLAWDEITGLLYAVSDQARLFHLRPEFDTRGYLAGVQVVAAYPLRNAAGAPLRPPFHDAEDLALLQISGRPPELLIPFEHKPRLARYTTQGRWRGEIPLPAPWRAVGNYRDPNQGLEAIALSPRWGWLLGTEQPLRSDPDRQIRLFARHGRSWRYPLSDAPGSALVAMTVLPDGGFLTLERAFVHPLRPLIIQLRRTDPLSTSDASPLLTVTELARFDTSQGWLMDNFEGLALHRNQHFFMVSDNNCRALQSTLLVYFALDSATGPPP